MVTLSPILRDLAYRSTPRLIMSLRPQDPIPDWITHLAILGHNYTLAVAGRKEEVLYAVHRWADAHGSQESGTVGRMAALMTSRYGQPLLGIGHKLSPKGVSPYMTYSRIMSSKNPSYIQPTGEVVPEHLNQENKRLWQIAAGKPPEKASLNDLLALTCPLPTDFKGEYIGPPDGESFSVDPGLNHQKADTAISAPLEPTSMNALIELQNVVVSYGSKIVLGQGVQPGFSEPGLNLTIRQGTRLALLGPNGSGKTTFLSLITSDHPQSYSLPIKYFGRSRLPLSGQAGLSLWEIQSRIGHSSPEIHTFFPKGLTIRRSLESAWAETFAGKPTLSEETKRLIDAFLKWWEPELNPGSRPLPLTAPTTAAIDDWVTTSYPPFKRSAQSADELEWASSPFNTFGSLPFQSQRLLLFLRAIIKQPDIVILDEGFSGFSPEVRDRAMLFLQKGEGWMLRRHRTATDERAGYNEDRHAREISPWKATMNRRSDVETICREMNITVDDLLVGKKKLKHNNRRRVGHLKSMTENELIAIATSKGRMGSAFTGLNPEQALIVVSHVREEIPNTVNEYVRLPSEEEVSEEGKTVEIGRCEDGNIRTVEGWNRIWGLRAGGPEDLKT
jgi:ABC-type molybdenum transport system ATPase subunit/photorepair protein PhrA